MKIKNLRETLHLHIIVFVNLARFYLISFAYQYWWLK